MPKTTRVAGTTPKPEMLPHEKAELAELLAQAYPQKAPPEPTVEVPPKAEPKPKAQPAPAKAEPEKVEHRWMTAAEHALAILEDLDLDAEDLRTAILTGKLQVIPWKRFRIVQFTLLRLARLCLYLYTLLAREAQRRQKRKK